MNVYPIPETLAGAYHGCGYALAAIVDGRVVDDDRAADAVGKAGLTGGRHSQADDVLFAGSDAGLGLIGGAANAIEPGKRMLSSMTPTIVERDGKLWMVVGTPGGSTIITSVFQTILNVHEWGKTAPDAVAAPRFHSQWVPDVIFVEDKAVEETARESLRSMGHVIEKRGPIGRVECILLRGDGRLEGGADVRGDDHAAGF